MKAEIEAEAQVAIVTDHRHPVETEMMKKEREEGAVAETVAHPLGATTQAVAIVIAVAVVVIVDHAHLCQDLAVVVVAAEEDSIKKKTLISLD